MAALPTAELERVFREEYGRAVAVLVRVFRDIDIAEEAVQDAFTTALERWPTTGLPPSPRGWIITTDYYYLWHAIRADLFRRLGRHEEAAVAYDAALARTGNAAERAFLERSRQALTRP